MKNTITIGTIWKDNRTGKTFEVTAVNNKIQLSPTTGEQVYSIMSEKSLRKHYKLIAMSLKEFKPELAVVTTQAKETPAEEAKQQSSPVVDNTGNVTQVQEKKSTDSKKRMFGFVELLDGKVVSGKVYFEDYLKIDFKSVAHGEPSQIYFLRRKSQAALLEKFNAKIIYRDSR